MGYPKKSGRHVNKQVNKTSIRNKQKHIMENSSILSPLFKKKPCVYIVSLYNQEIPVCIKKIVNIARMLNVCL